MNRWICRVLIVTGILIGLYPLMDRIYTWYWQSQIMTTYNELDTVFTEESENIFLPGEARVQEDEIDITQVEEESQEIVQGTVEEQSVENQSIRTAAKEEKQSIGILKIKKINLELPILSGATQKNMKIGAGWLKETSNLGQVGNTALAAHRSHTYGRFFNRLDELEMDDEIIISTGSTAYTYKVYEKIVVEPTDISVLKRSKKDKVLTLITCHPLYTASHRLIVKAKIEE